MKIVQRVVSLTLAILGLGILGLAPSAQAAVPEGSVSKDCLVKTVPCVLDKDTYKWGRMSSTKPDAEWACLFKGIRLADVAGISLTCYRAFGGYAFSNAKMAVDVTALAGQTTDSIYAWNLAEDELSATFQVQMKDHGYFGVDFVRLEQRGDDIWGAVVAIKYPPSFKYGDDPLTYSQSNTCKYYYDDDAMNSGHDVMNFSLQDMQLWYYAGAKTLNVTFVDGDDQVIATRTVDRGEAADAPTEEEMAGHVPEGYVLAGWDVSFSKIYQDTTVKALYHKLYTVTFQNPDGTVIDVQKVEEGTDAEAPDMADRTYDDMPFSKWNVKFASVTEDLVVTAIYANTVALWKKADVAYPLTGEEIVMFKNLDITAISKVRMDVFHRYSTGSEKGQAVYTSDEAPLAEGQHTGSGIYSYVQDETTGAITFEFRGINHNTSYSGLVSAFKWTMWQDGADVKGKMLWFKGGAYANQHLDKPSWDSVNLTYQVTDGMASDKANYAAKVYSFEAFVEVPASYKVTFRDRGGNVLKTQNVPLGAAATAPEAPEVAGYTFAGWDADFSVVERVLDIHPIYHRLCTVRFLDADGSVLDTQVVEETLAAEAPDMTGKTYDGNPFKAWDVEFEVITGDLDVTAVYGQLSSAVKKAIASGLLEGVENALIWSGGDGVWDLTSANWSTAKGMDAKWRADAIAIFAENATVSVSDAVSVGEIRTLADATAVTLTGTELELVSPAKIHYAVSGKVRFETDLTGNAGIHQTTEAEVTGATEIAGKYDVVGEFNVANGTVTATDEALFFNGVWNGGTSSCVTPIILGTDTRFIYDSTAALEFKTLLGARNTGSGYATIKKCVTNGRLVIGPNARSVKMTCSSEGLHRFYDAIDIYGTVTLPDQTYHLVNENSYGFFVYDGGVLSMGNGYGAYGHRDQRLTAYEGATINYTKVQSMGISDTFAIFDGATAHFTADYTLKAADDTAHKNITLKNGALMDGVMMTWARQDINGGNNKITVDGTSASTVAIKKIRFGMNGKAAASGVKMLETLDVKDVTGDADVDLTVSSSIYKHATATCAEGNEAYFGIVKQGAGTVEFTGASPDFGASLTLEAGTVAFGATSVMTGSKLFVAGDAALAFTKGAQVTFNGLDLTAGKTLDITGKLRRGTLKFGADKNALSAAQLAQITYEGKTGKVYVDENGCLRANTALVLSIR